MKSRSILALCATLISMGVAADALAAFTWSPYFSEESEPPQQWCSLASQAVDGVRCQGSYCDDVSIRCNDLPFGMTTQGHNWEAQITNPDAIVIAGPAGDYIVSDENGHVCGLGNGILTGLHCSGSHCEDLFLECATPVIEYEGSMVAADFVNCDWSTTYSEEDPWFAYGASANRWITGIQCYNSHCDDKSYRVCQLADPRSCDGSCGTQASAGCWCDSLCTGMGDCCDDYVTACSTRN